MMDYENPKFTLDPVIQREIKQAFIRLYRDNLIEKGTRLIN
jgi:valyl-tRNA synthetase